MPLNLTQVSYIAFGAALVSTIIALTSLVILMGLRARLRKFMQGKTGSDLEAVLHAHENALKDSVRFKSESIEYFKFLDSRLKQKIGVVETVRFNPFQGTGNGGNQSFSTSFVNEEGNGVVISGIYSRDRAMVFSKPVTEWTSGFELSDEEKAAIAGSKNKTQNAKREK